MFPEPHGKEIDILIGIDNIDLHRAIKEVYVKQGDPIACLTPLGLTCIGASTKNECYSHFISSFHSTAGVTGLRKRNETYQSWTMGNVEQTSKTMDQNEVDFPDKDCSKTVAEYFDEKKMKRRIARLYWMVTVIGKKR